MFDIGIGELIALAAVGLLIFGPEKLPKAAADAGRWIRQIRQMANSARQELSESAGVDFSGAMDELREFRDLHPKRLAASVFDDDDTTRPATNRPTPAPGKPDATNASQTSQSSQSSQSSQTFDPDLS